MRVTFWGFYFWHALRTFRKLKGRADYLIKNKYMWEEKKGTSPFAKKTGRFYRFSFFFLKWLSLCVFHSLYSPARYWKTTWRAITRDPREFLLVSEKRESEIDGANKIDFPLQCQCGEETAERKYLGLLRLWFVSKQLANHSLRILLCFLILQRQREGELFFFWWVGFVKQE